VNNAERRYYWTSSISRNQFQPLSRNEYPSIGMRMSMSYVILADSRRRRFVGPVRFLRRLAKKTSLQPLSLSLIAPASRRNRIILASGNSMNNSVGTMQSSLVEMMTQRRNSRRISVFSKNVSKIGGIVEGIDCAMEWLEKINVEATTTISQVN